MFFKPIIARWAADDDKLGVEKLATALRLPTKNVRRWVDTDSIPGGWYLRVAATGLASLEELAAAATARDMKAEADRAAAKAFVAQRQDAAA